MRCALLFAWYAFLGSFRYCDNQLWPLTAPLSLVLPALLVGVWGARTAGVAGFMALSGTPNFVYLLLGAFYWNFVEVVWSVALSVQRALRSGVLEALWVAPIPRLGLLLGWSLARMLVVVPAFLVAAAFDPRFRWRSRGLGPLRTLPPGQPPPPNSQAGLDQDDQGGSGPNQDPKAKGDLLYIETRRSSGDGTQDGRRGTTSRGGPQKLAPKKSEAVAPSAFGSRNVEMKAPPYAVEVDYERPLRVKFDP